MRALERQAPYGPDIDEERARAESQETWQTFIEQHLGVHTFLNIYIVMLREPMVIEGFRHARAWVRACGPRGVT